MPIENWTEVDDPNANLAEPTGVRHKVFLIPEGEDIPASVLFASNAELADALNARAQDVTVTVHDRGLDFDPVTNRYGMWIEYTPNGNSFLAAAAVIAAVAALLAVGTWTYQTVSVIHGNVDKADLPGLPGVPAFRDLSGLLIVGGLLFALYIFEPILSAGAEAGAAGIRAGSK